MSYIQAPVFDSKIKKNEKNVFKRITFAPQNDREGWLDCIKLTANEQYGWSIEQYPPECICVTSPKIIRELNHGIRK